MANRKLIVRSETLPYLSLFDLNKLWLNLKTNRQTIWQSIRQQRKEMYNLTMEITQIEEKLSDAIQKLDKNNV